MERKFVFTLLLACKRVIDAKLPNHALQALNNVRTYVHTCVFENLFLNMTRKREREREKYARAYDDAILWVFPLHFPLSSSFSFVLSLLLFRASSSLFSLLLLSLSLSPSSLLLLYNCSSFFLHVLSSNVFLYSWIYEIIFRLYRLNLVE